MLVIKSYTNDGGPNDRILPESREITLLITRQGIKQLGSAVASNGMQDFEPPQSPSL
jgi:hypothetical protein